MSGLLGQAPPTRVAPVTEVLHGVRITDPYRWLEDQNSPETRAWIDAQMSYTQQALAKLPQRKRIQSRLAELIKVDQSEVPVPRGGRYFFRKRRAAENQYALYYRDGLTGPDRILLDPNPLSPDHTTSVELLDVSEDGKLIAYGLREGGQDETTLAFRQVDTGRDLADAFPSARYSSVTLAPDNRGIYYMKMLAEGPRVYYHQLGSAPASDAIIFGEFFGPSQLGGCYVSHNGRWLYCQVYTGSSGDKVDIYVRDLQGSPEFQPVAVGLNAGFQVDIGDDAMYMQTTLDAPNGRIVKVDLTHPARENWQEVIPERKSVLDSFTLTGGKIAAQWLENVHSHIEIFDAAGKFLRELKLPGLGVAGGPYGRWDLAEAFFTFNSLAQPNAVYRYLPASGAQSEWFRPKVPFDASSIETTQVWYNSKDGTRIPMFLAYQKGLKRDGSHPVLLTGYGGFNVSEMPGYSSTAVAWIGMGGIYALPNLRGGGEFGEAWHQAGMLANKQNVFDDFIAAAEYLIREKYTNPRKLGIWGGSNGGLLVGAALTQRPDLFQAVICGAPLLDMLRFDKFLVAKFWVPEYGTADDPEQFKVLYKYSPYQHVDPGAKYPAVLLVTGDNDTRVDPLHARKMAALLQAATTSGRPVMLHYDTKAGHSGGLPVDRVIENTADELAFFSWQLGIR